MTTTLDAAVVNANVTLALREDIGPFDITGLLISSRKHAVAEIIARESMVVCGIAWVNAVFKSLDRQSELLWYVQDGDFVQEKTCLVRIHAHARALLAGERVALNFLQMLSGIATVTRTFALKIKTTKTQLLDTRKTIPGLRYAQKYAVRCGGGHNHRMGLYDVYLIKENHIAALGSITAAVDLARQQNKRIPIIAEVESIAELQEALSTSVDRILLDNFSLDMLRESVALVQAKLPLEFSGDINLENIYTIAELGVDYISVGGLTKHVRAVDLSMRFIEEE